MKFAHMADCHIGGWSEPELEKLGIKSFEKAIDICIKKHVAFVIIAGDLFNTSLPPIDLIKETTRILNKLKEQEISCYIIPGSHDYSPSGKTMIDVLEKATLVENVAKYNETDGKIKLKFTTDKTGVKLTGIFGKKQGLETEFYKSLDRTNLEQEKGTKIFLFHTLLSELKTKELEMVNSESLAILPKNFNYYAGGHPHIVKSTNKEGYGLIAYPGPIFPNNFAELEKLKHGGFNILNDNFEIEHIPIELKEVISLKVDVNDKSPQEAQEIIIKEIRNNDIKDKILILRIFGALNSGKISDINFKDILSETKESYITLKNTNKLTTKEFEEIKVETGNVTDVEDKIITENIKEDSILNKEKIVALMDILSLEKQEGETNSTFEERLIKNIEETLK
ncbi:MAG: DNA repair exonuclease [Candidatus Woesearchaeota archaeon]